MKNCRNCKYLYSDCYENSSYACELFGEDIPEWASNYNDGCLLKSQEVKKTLKLSNSILVYGSSKELDEFGYPKFTLQDENHNKFALIKYKNYIEELKKRCLLRKNKEKQ